MIFSNGSVVVSHRDARSESIGSLSSTVDARAPPKLILDDGDDAAPEPLQPQFVLVDGDANTPGRFDMILPENRPVTSEERVMRDAVSSIIVLDSKSRPEVRTLLHIYNGHLVEVGPHLLEGLRCSAPSRLAARVGDFNENLFYEMRDRDQDVGSIVRGSKADENTCIDSFTQRDIDAFEASISQSLNHRKFEYRGSFMQTECTMAQPAHVDYDYPILQMYGRRLFLAFFPLSEEGAFLQLWQDPLMDENDDEHGKDEGLVAVAGTVVYIPYGKMLILPSRTIHGGGFKRGIGGNLRFHLYIAVEDADENNQLKKAKDEKKIELLDHPMNKYTEERDRRRELCERFVDTKGLDCLMGVFFND